MQEQIAVLALDHGEWLFVTDDDPDRVWQDFDAAMEELRQEGWQIAEGPGPIRTDIEGFERFDPWGYRLRRGVH